MLQPVMDMEMIHEENMERLDDRKTVLLKMKHTDYNRSIRVYWDIMCAEIGGN